jgi:hypothetical protein
MWEVNHRLLQEQHENHDTQQSQFDTLRRRGFLQRLFAEAFSKAFNQPKFTYNIIKTYNYFVTVISNKIKSFLTKNTFR